MCIRDSSYSDAQVDDARYVAMLARTAASYGAHVASRVRVEGFLKVGERVVGVTARDLMTDETVSYTHLGLKESHPHDVQMVIEAPNYKR